MYHQKCPRGTWSNRRNRNWFQIHFGESARSICELRTLQVSCRTTSKLRSLDTESPNTCTRLRHISCWLWLL